MALLGFTVPLKREKPFRRSIVSRGLGAGMDITSLILEVLGSTPALSKQRSKPRGALEMRLECAMLN